DFYDFIHVDPWHLGIVIADVSGHGTAAALLMAAAKKVLQLVGRGSLSPRDTILEVNDNIRPDVPRGMFFTVFYGVLDIRKLQMSFVSCGHNHPILRRGDSASDQWDLENAPPLGVVGSKDMERVLVEKSIQLQPTDVLMLYTDGLTEAFDGDGEMYGEERLLSKVKRASASTAQTMIDAVSNDIDKFRGSAVQSDDETMLVVRVAEHTGKITPLIAVSKDKALLPTWDTPLFGRKKEVAELSQTLRDGEQKTITVTGPVGAGKTRVAVSAAKDASGKFYGGTYFVDLHTAKSLDDVLRLVSAELKLGSDTTRLGLRIAMALQSSAGRTLLILDNCDGCFKAVCRCIDEWRTRAEGLTVLTTSGRPLGAANESLVKLNPLATISGSNIDLEAAAKVESIAMFENAARSADGSFQLTQQNVSEIAAICRKLDGLPQAIEMAASRVSLLSPRQILKQLDERLESQTDDHTDALQSTLALSFELLTAEEQLAVLLLSCFKDGFQLEAATAALEAVQGPRPEDLVRTLMNNNLLRFERSEKLGGERRFFLYESVRQFAYTKLRGKTEIREYYEDAVVGYAHAWWLKEKQTTSLFAKKRVMVEAANLLDIAEKCNRPVVRAKASYMAAPLLHAHGETERAIQLLSTALDELPTDSEDALWVRAIDASIRSLGAPKQVLDDLEGVEGDSLINFQVAYARSHALKTLGRIDEAVETVKSASKLPNLHPLQKAILKERLSTFQAERGELDDARRGLAAVLKLVREHKDTSAESRVLYNLGWVYMRSSKPAEAMEFLKEGLKASQLEGDRTLESNILGTLAFGLHLTGESQAAEASMKSALRLAREIGLTHTESAHLNTLARIYHELGRDREALEACEQARDLAREIGSRSSEAVAEGNVASLRMELGELDGVLESLENAYDILVEIGSNRAAFANIASMGRYYAALYEQNGMKRDLNFAIDKLFEACDGRREHGFDPISEAEVLLAELLVTANRRKDARPVLEQVIETTQDAKDSMSQKLLEQATEMLDGLGTMQPIAPRRQSGTHVKQKFRLPGNEPQIVKAPKPAPGSGTFTPVKPRNTGSGVYPPVKKRSGGSGLYPPVKKRSGGSGLYSPIPDKAVKKPMMTPPPPTRPRKKPAPGNSTTKRAPMPTRSGTNPPKKPISGRAPGIPPKGGSKGTGIPQSKPKTKPGTMPKPRPRKP
ncbi:MAG: SpoIIE family protein phosphatase, partial [Planctomycetota bacterium]